MGSGSFQSLSGFLMRCEPTAYETFTDGLRRFQSLSGFLMRCEVVGALRREPGVPVSIPIGFSDAL